MTLTHVLRHDAMRRLPLWIGRGLLVTLAFLGLYGVLVLSRPPLAAAVAALAVWCGPAVYLAACGGRQRCGPLELALPIPARRLWLVHVAALALATATLALAGGAVVTLVSGLLARIGRPGQPAVDGFTLALDTAVAFAFAALLAERSNPVLVALSRWRMVAAAAVALLVLAALGFLPPVWTAVTLAAAFVLGLLTYRRLPAAFALAAHQPEARTSVAAAVPAWNVGVRRGSVTWIALRILLRSSPTALVVPPTFILMGLGLSGLYAAASGGEEIRFTLISLTIYCCLSFLPAPMKQLHRLDPLPLPRRTVFALLILVPLGLTVAGYSAGRVAVGALEKGEGPVFPAIFLLLGPGWVVSASVFFSAFRAGIREGWRKVTIIALMVGLLVFHVIQYAAGPLLGIADIPVVTGVVKTTIRGVGASPVASVLLWVVSLAAFAVVYRWGERRFLRIEVLP